MCLFKSKKLKEENTMLASQLAKAKADLEMVQREHAKLAGEYDGTRLNLTNKIKQLEDEKINLLEEVNKLNKKVNSLNAKLKGEKPVKAAATKAKKSTVKTVASDTTESKAE